MLLAGAAGVGVCLLLDLVLLGWMRLGPPAGTDPNTFFFKVAPILGGMLVVAAVVVLAPSRARTLVPFVFLVLAWHTGFEVALIQHQAGMVISMFDILVPIVLGLAVIGRWNADSRLDILKPFRRPLIVFYLVCLWGLAMAWDREIDLFVAVLNVRSYIIYPLIALIIPLCLRSWRQLYGAIAGLLIIILERALEGLRQSGNFHGVHTATAMLANGQELQRINGNFGDENTYAFFLLPGLIILAALIASGCLKKLTPLLLVPLAPIALAMVLTLSRGAWMGGAVGLVVLAVLLGARRGVRLIAVALFAIALVGVLDSKATDAFMQRASEQQGGTILKRQNLASIGFAVIRHYPLGAGWGASFHLGPGDQPVADNFLRHYEDDYLEIATEVGVWGLAIWLSLLATILFLGVRGWRAARNPNHRVIFAGLIASLSAMYVQPATEYFYWYAPIAPYIWIVVGLLFSALVLLRTAPGESRSAS